MKYYVYGRNTKNAGFVPGDYLTLDHDVLNLIVFTIKQAQDMYRSGLKVKIYDDFEKFLIYADELSNTAIDFYELVYIGEVIYNCSDINCLPSLILNMNEELRADTLEVELTEIEGHNLINCFRDFAKFGINSELRHAFRGDHKMLDDTLLKIEEILDDNRKTNQTN